MRNEKGFTLIELLVVIVILGILAAVVVFAVSGLTDRGQDSACEIDARSLRTAMEAHYAENNAYPAAPAAAGDETPETALVTAGLLDDESQLNDITYSAYPGGTFTGTAEEGDCL
jgi:general secretion pathway protein G